MSLDKRIRAIEDQLTYLQAIIDGSEAQAREATTYIISLLTQHLHEIGVIDAQALQAYLARFGGNTSDSEDHMGEYVRIFADMVGFHQRYPEDPVPPTGMVGQAAT